MDEVDLEELGIPLKINLKTPIFKHIDNYIGYEDLFGNIIDKLKNKRCIIKYKNKTISGGYGRIYFAKRNTKDIVIKRLLGDTHTNLFKEAFLQHISYLTLKKYNLDMFISTVLDIF